MLNVVRLLGTLGEVPADTGSPDSSLSGSCRNRSQKVGMIWFKCVETGCSWQWCPHQVMDVTEPGRAWGSITHLMNVVDCEKGAL